MDLYVTLISLHFWLQARRGYFYSLFENHVVYMEASGRKIIACFQKFHREGLIGFHSNSVDEFKSNQGLTPI